MNKTRTVTFFNFFSDGVKLARKLAEIRWIKTELQRIILRRRKNRRQTEALKQPAM